MTPEERDEIWELSRMWVAMEVSVWQSIIAGDEIAAEDYSAEADYYHNELRNLLGMPRVDSIGLAEMAVSADKARRDAEKTDSDLDAEIAALLDDEGEI